MSTLRLAVVGSRDYLDYPEFSSLLDLLLSTWPVPTRSSNGWASSITLISGGARGADSLAHRYSQEHRLPITIHWPDWDQYGRAAGMIRNKSIVQDCTALVAFWDGESRGTKNSIDLAKRAGKPTFVFNTRTKIRTAFNRGTCIVP